MSDRNQDSFEPRHRIVGAIILVTFGLVLFSALLDDQPRMRPAGPVVESGTPETKIVVTPVPQPALPRTGVAAPTPAPIKPAPPTTVAQPARPTAPVEPAPGPVAKAAPVIDQYMVQVGVFANSANARELRDRLQGERYAVELKVIALKQGTGVRVRVGPYGRKTDAEAAQESIRKKFDIKGTVLSVR